MTLKFKTNINCGGCLATVKPFLDELKNAHWEVDLQHPDRVLSVTAEGVSEEAITEKVKQAGFKAEKLN